MEDCEISLKSTCEEVANFFVKKFKIDTKLKDCLIKEGISGDVLLDLVKYKNYFGFKPATWNQIKKFLERNKDLFKSKIVYENISIKDEKEIKIFFENYIGFKGNINDINNEKSILELKEEDMKNLGLNLGQRIRLLKFIIDKTFKITITKNSSTDETLNYVKNV